MAKGRIVDGTRAGYPVTPAPLLRGSPGHADTRVVACPSVKGLRSKTLPRKRYRAAEIFAIRSHAARGKASMTQIRVASSAESVSASRSGCTSRPPLNHSETTLLAAKINSAGEGARNHRVPRTHRSAYQPNSKTERPLS